MYLGFRYKSTDPNVDEKDFSQIDHKRFISKGVYDSDGICSYEMNWQLEANECLYIGSPNDFKYCYLWNCHGYQRAAKVLNSKDEPRLVFDAVMSGDFEDEFPIEERTYGFFDSINCYAVQRFVDSKASQGGFLSFILDGSKLYLFESAAELDAFLEFDCHSAKEMQSAYTLNGKEYSKKWKTPFVSNWWFMRAIESMARDDEKKFKVAYRDMGAFPEAAKNDIKNIEKSCWNTSFGTKAVYSPYGFNNIVFNEDYYTVYKVSKKKQQGNAKIEYLTEEQYEKYKDRLEYDSAKQRHYVKKADNSRLYVPDQYEKLIEKTADEIKKDEELAEQQKTEYKKAEKLFSVLTEAKMLQGLVSSLPKLDESLFE